MRIVTLLCFAPLLLPLAAYAQVDQADRLDQLEQEIRVLKRQVPHMGSERPPAEAPASGIATAQTDVRITALEEELRNLRGKIEEQDFATKRVAEELEKFKRDNEFRMGELEKLQAPKTDDAIPAPAETPPPAKPEEKTGKKKLDVSVKEVPVTTSGTLALPEDAPKQATEEAPAPAVAPPANTSEGETPRDHYNYAFRLLNQNQYEEAAKSFASFTKKYPKDPLVGNAFYWQGETYYIRKNFTKAADYFRQGYEALPKGPKSGDNLLKLGMSLSALEKNKEACIVLSQAITRYKATSASIAGKAQAESKRIGCE